MSEYVLIPIVLLIVASAGDILLISSDRSRFRIFTKPVLMPLLVFIYLSLAITPRWFILGGLIAGWAGDVILLNRKKSAFFLGLSSFLVGHVFYILTFLLDISQPAMTPLVLTAILGFAALAWFILSTIWPAEREYQLGLLLYSAALTALGISAFARLEFVGGVSGILVAAGSLLFIFSDTMLGYSYFKKRFRGDQLLIMISYILAQAGIVSGIILNA
ncbi:lysoplasmalogenase [Salinispira pacifica]|uniref:Putative membrane protein n=1 Tax=Salinispira pacifica TaxID=1307761 RepID=V5WDA2_9SPIO|nr:lysoplasmalogenase [Salinispira pacifica]AHC13575.1 putative membrane protein [Salinispira pacifica]